VDQVDDFSEHNSDTISCKNPLLDRVAQRLRMPWAFTRPNPKGWDPTKPAPMLRWRQQRILRREQNAHFPEKLLR
jgi:hypothetical protein